MYGSSTIGVKKSRVPMRASSPERRNTPASSACEVPTSTRGSSGGGNADSTRARTPCPSLDAQPAQDERWVRKIFSRSLTLPLSLRGTGLRRGSDEDLDLGQHVVLASPRVRLRRHEEDLPGLPHGFVPVFPEPV